MSKKYKQSFFGFTLIELLIVLAIVSLGASILIVSFGSSQIQRELESNAREVVGMVREAQNNALTGKQFMTNTTPCRFRVSWSETGYSMTYLYKDSSDECTQTYPVASAALKNGVTFNGSGSFDFTLPHAALSGSGNVLITLMKQGKSRTVCVYDTGLINDLSEPTCP